ncbi:MAG: ArsR family transcriptional regulator [Gemmatimonadota bacterium]
MTDGTAGRIVALLRRRPMTIDDLAGKLGLTRTAVRAQLTTLLADGVIEPRGTRPSSSKPARMYGMTPDAELQLSMAYIPVLTQLLDTLAARLPAEEFDGLLREVGHNLVSGPSLPRGDLRDRVTAANGLLIDLGGLTEVSEERGLYVIRSHGCPLAAATRNHPAACNIIESLLREMIGQPVTQCCDREGRARCCFEVSAGAA